MRSGTNTFTRNQLTGSVSFFTKSYMQPTVTSDLVLRVCTTLEMSVLTGKRRRSLRKFINKLSSTELSEMPFLICHITIAAWRKVKKPNEINETNKKERKACVTQSLKPRQKKPALFVPRAVCCRSVSFLSGPSIRSVGCGISSELLQRFSQRCNRLRLIMYR